MEAMLEDPLMGWCVTVTQGAQEGEDYFVVLHNVVSSRHPVPEHICGDGKITRVLSIRVVIDVGDSNMKHTDRALARDTAY